MKSPETVLQFGAGNFLRAFVNVFLHEAHESGPSAGHAVVVQSTNSNRAALLNAQNGSYHVVTRGIQNGQQIDATQRIDSISRALIAKNQWSEVLAAGRSPGLQWIVSNVTEAGLTLEPAEQHTNDAPLSFPAKLLSILYARFQADLPGISILPCELVDRNGDIVRNLVIKQAKVWRLSDEFFTYLHNDIRWHNTLVDRIVSGKPDAHPLLSEDPLLTVAEPFALWVIEAEADDPLIKHTAVQRTNHVDPFSLRKVRLLNGAHTALVSKALPMGIPTVREAVEHPQVGPWLRQLLFEEIVPAVQDRLEDTASFAEQVLERFANPFLDHRLSDIALHHKTKVQVRLMSTYREYQSNFGKNPPLLHELLKDDLRNSDEDNRT